MVRLRDTQAVSPERGKGYWVDSILLVYPKGWREHVAESCRRHGLTKVEHLVKGVNIH